MFSHKKLALPVALLLCLSGCHHAGPVNPAAKATQHRYSNLRSGAIKTSSGWDLKDFAVGLFNPNPEEITVTWKMISDDPKFAFRNSVGTWTMNLKIPAMKPRTLNSYSPEIWDVADPTVTNVPVAARSNFTGTAEFSSSLPFYVYGGHQFETGETSGADPDRAWYKAWDVWQNAVPASWDSDLQQFVIPYSNYWHNVEEYVLGWHSTLSIKNNTQQTVTYAIHHVVPPYAMLRDPGAKCRAVSYQDQTVEVTLKKGEELNTTLESLYGWPNNQVSTMEGAVLIRPNPITAASGTSVSSAVVPNSSGSAACGGISGVGSIAVVITSPVANVSGTVDVAANTVQSPFSAIEKLEFYIDGTLAGTATNAPYSFKWDTTSVPNGPHLVTAKGYDTWGSNAAVHSVTMTVSNPGR